MSSLDPVGGSTSSDSPSFFSLPLSTIPTPAYPRPAKRQLFIRPHRPKIPTATSSRSLFVSNVPADATSAHLRDVFTGQLSTISRITEVEFGDTALSRKPAKSVLVNGARIGKKRKRTVAIAEEDLNPDLPSPWDRQLRCAGSTAVVTFVDKPSMAAALKSARRAAASEQQVKWGVKDDMELPKLGGHRYIVHQQLSFPNPEQLQEKVDTFMTTFDAMEAEKTRRAARQRAQPDEDGFVTVTRGGRNGPVKEEEARERLEKMREKERKDKERLEGFYRFQGRERRKREVQNLAAKFAEDKKKVADLRRGRDALVPM